MMNKMSEINLIVEQAMAEDWFCGCCGKEEWESDTDISYTKNKLGADFK